MSCKNLSTHNFIMSVCFQNQIIYLITIDYHFRDISLQRDARNAPQEYSPLSLKKSGVGIVIGIIGKIIRIRRNFNAML